MLDELVGMFEGERTVTGHARFTRHTGGNDDNVGARQAFAESGGGLIVALDGALGVDMADISSDTCFG